VLESAIIRENITISLGVVSLLVSSAFLEKINLTVGVIGHKGSTVIVILNGLRLLRFRGK
jgi:Zn2+/Cd2+-exporting ATPase